MSNSLCSTILLGIALISSVQGNISVDDATSDCQTALVACYEERFQHFDQDAYTQCQRDAFNTYGMDVCIPCGFTMNEEYATELPKNHLCRDSSRLPICLLSRSTSNLSISRSADRVSTYLLSSNHS
mmetsp:Transcript_24574/g.27955  ORF Transcript_24574/g.27955 Transcript_24574/m.27955 type:complete len:127 (+) Transcript_24574:252-632(+)